MQVDPQEVIEGLSAAKSRVAQRLGHLEKTRDQKAPTTDIYKPNHFLDRLDDQGGEGRVYIHREQRIGGEIGGVGMDVSPVEPVHIC